jgi:hypothetical protein
MSAQRMGRLFSICRLQTARKSGQRISRKGAEFGKFILRQTARPPGSEGGNAQNQSNHWAADERG